MLPQRALAAVTSEEVERAAKLFSSVKQLRSKLTSFDDSQLDSAFEGHVENVLTRLEVRLPVIEHKSLAQIETVMCRHGIYDAAFQQLILLCNSISPSLSTIMKDLRLAHSAFFSDIQRYSSDLVSELDKSLQDTAAAEREREKAATENNRMMNTLELLDKEAEEHNRQIIELRLRLRASQQRILDLGGDLAESLTVDELSIDGDHLASDLDSPIYASTTPNIVGQVVKGSKSIAWTSPKESLDHLREESSLASGSGIYNRGPATTPTRRGTRQEQEVSFKRQPFNNAAINNNNNNNNGPSKRESARPTSNSNNNNSRVSSSIAGESAGPSPSSSEGLTAWVMSFRRELQASIDSGRNRSLTVNECKDHISKIFESKAAHDEKLCSSAASLAAGGTGNIGGPASSVGGIKGNEGPETLEAHMYHMYEKKYGLRTLAVDHAAMFMNAVNRYADEENEIAVFKKILLNDIEEDFRLVQHELNRSIRDLLVVQIMKKHPNKSQTEVSSMFERKTVGRINEMEWTDILNYLYNAPESTCLGVILKKLAAEDAQLTDTNGPGSPSPRKAPVEQKTSFSYLRVPASAKPEKRPFPSLAFETFRKAVLDFQLSSHDEYLKSIQKAFKLSDEDGDGYISAEDFHRCFIYLQSRKIAEESTDGKSKDIDRNKSSSNRSRSVGPQGNTAPKRSGGILRSPKPAVDDEIGYVFNDEEQEIFTSLLSEADPQETDRITFSAAASALLKIEVVKSRIQSRK